MSWMFTRFLPHIRGILTKPVHQSHLHDVMVSVLHASLGDTSYTYTPVAPEWRLVPPLRILLADDNAGFRSSRISWLMARWASSRHAPLLPQAKYAHLADSMEQIRERLLAAESVPQV